MNNGVLTVEVEPAAEDGSDDTDSDSGSETEVQN
jgi:hypothetical protein